MDLLGVIAEEDPTKAIWPASPSNGWVSGVARLWATPDGTPLEARELSTSIEAHGPYIRGRRLPAVNGVTNYEPVATDVLFDEAPVGLSHASSSPSSAPWPGPLPNPLPRRCRRGTGRSSAISRRTSVRATAFRTCQRAQRLALRNYPCANFVGSFFGPSADYLRPGATPPP